MTKHHHNSTDDPMNSGQKIIPFLPKQRAWWCHFYAACFSFFILTPLLVMVLDRRQPVELTIDSIVPLNAKAGDEVTVNYSSHVKRDGCGGELLRTIIDSANVRIAFVREPTVFNNRKVGTDATFRFSKTFIVPRGAAIGPAIYAPLIDRWCNPLQRYLWPIQQDPAPTGHFNVVN